MRRWIAPPISLPERMHRDERTRQRPKPKFSPTAPTIAAQDAIAPEELDRLTDEIIAALKTVYDPEIPADIYELGLIYRVDIDESRFVKIDMTLTAPGCPVAGEMPIWVENAVAAVPGVAGVEVQHGVRSAVGPEPHVRRGPRRARHVVNFHRASGAMNCPKARGLAPTGIFLVIFRLVTSMTASTSSIQQAASASL